MTTISPRAFELKPEYGGIVSYVIPYGPLGVALDVYAGLQMNSGKIVTDDEGIADALAGETKLQSTTVPANPVLVSVPTAPPLPHDGTSRFDYSYYVQRAELEAELADFPPAARLGPDELGYRPNKLGHVILPGASGAWDEAMVEGGQVFWDSLRHRWGMVYVGYSGALSGGFPPAGSLGKVGLAWSDDLLSWTKDAGNPIFQGTGNVGTDWDGGTVTAPVMFVHNGSYYLYYIGVSTVGWEASGGGTFHMGLAIGDPFGNFTRQGQIISPAGSGTGWRSNHVFHPSIVERDGVWYLFFNASRQSDSVEQIGFATAPDPAGPWTVDDVHSPVLSGSGVGGSWDQSIVADPYVFRSVDGKFWFMAYTASAGAGYINDGFAWTTDAEFPEGWRRHQANPFLSRGKQYDYLTCGKPCIVRHRDVTYHFYSAKDEGNAVIGIALAAKGIRGLLPKRFVGGAGQPAFGTNWGLNGAGFDELHFYRDGEDVVIDGVVKANANQAANSTIFTLPMDFRPRSSPGGYTRWALLTTPDTNVRINIQSSGAVRLVPTINSGQFVSLNGARFRPD